MKELERRLRALEGEPGRCLDCEMLQMQEPGREREPCRHPRLSLDQHITGLDAALAGGEHGEH